MSLRRHIVIVTGLSGAGKSTAIRAMEDAGYFCIDNLPVTLVPKLTEMLGSTEQSRLALGIDAREKQYLRQAPVVIDEMRRAGHDVEVLFFDAAEEALVRRFSETRRRHPLAPDRPVTEGIAAERLALADLRHLADQIIDTSTLTVHELKRMLLQRFSEEGFAQPSLSVVSFGYRYGVPPQADLVFDVRFLPNPYFVPDLRPLTGRDEKVARYVLEQAEAREFLDLLVGLCQFVIPRYQKEGKSYVTIAVGCTGGKHRSVALAHELARRLDAPPMRIQVWHRDVEKE